MRGVVAVLGNFDGVHLGHRAVLRRGLEVARERGVELVAATFDPHPRAVLWPGDEPKLLTSLDLRREELVRQGVGEVYAIHFDRALSKKTPEEFVRDVLVGEIGARIVVVGENFRFGHRASGDFGDLKRLMREAWGDAFAVSLQNTSGAEITSTRIRALIAAGDVGEASRLLGRPYVLRGEVIEGDRRGRTIGFPTANVLPDPTVIVPARGVYAGFVRIDGKGICGLHQHWGRADIRQGRESGRGPFVGFRGGSLRSRGGRGVCRESARGEKILGRGGIECSDNSRCRGGAGYHAAAR